VKNLDLDSILFYCLLLAFTVAYLFMFPMGWLISDEYTYVNQAIAISQGNTSLSFIDEITNAVIPYNFTRYTLGNSFWIAIWVKLFGVQCIYLGSLFGILVGSWLLYKGLQQVGYFIPALCLIFIYPSLEFFGSSTMSAIPSFLLSCLFIYGLIARIESPGKWFWLCLLASFSFWIRETNIVLLGGICFIHFLQDRRWFGYYLMGALVGLLPRLVSSYFFYDDPFYYLLAESFGWSNIAENITIYALLSMICMPFGLVFLGAYIGRYRWPIVISTFAYLSLYLTYSFNASTYSGFSKGIILMGRFLIPVLPFFVLSVAWYLRNKSFNKVFTSLFFVIVMMAMLGMKFQVYQEGKVHKEVSNYVYENYEDSHVFFDLSRKTNILRYLNPIHGEFANQSDMTKLLDKGYMTKSLNKSRAVFILQTVNTENTAKSELTGSIQSIIDEASEIYIIELEKELKIKPGLKLQILKIENRKLK
jgi:hypothetical protein|tara:strand:- start:336 stop:1763 length:1428 start_codon:yes stop_codon:yes gene_type:complete